MLVAHALGVLAALAVQASLGAFVDALAAIGTLGAGMFAAAQSVRGALAANGLLMIVFAHAVSLKLGQG
jgi:malonyl CoA-acyl carrier protein transacylase